MPCLSAYTDQEKDETGLMYYDARYYDADLKRFTSVDPVAVYDLQRAVEAGPQTLNPYSYVSNNPLKYTDPTGEWYKEFFIDNINPFATGQSWSSFNTELGQATQQMTSDSQAWNVAVSNPKTTGLAVGVGSGIRFVGATATGVAGLVTVKSAELGVGGVSLTSKALQTGMYGYLTSQAPETISGLIDLYADVDSQDRSTWAPAAIGTVKEVGSIFLPEEASFMVDVAQTVVGVKEDLTDKDN